jgi:voltage-gated potassium channel
MNKRPPLPGLHIDDVRARRLFFFLGQMMWKGKTIFFILLANIIIGGLLFSLFDKKPIAEGQYLALITGLTVGYGDLAPVSWPARIVSGLVGTNGLILTGVIIAFTVKALELTFAEDLEKIRKQAESKEPDSDQ